VADYLEEQQREQQRQIEQQMEEQRAASAVTHVMPDTPAVKQFFWRMITEREKGRAESADLASDGSCLSATPSVPGCEAPPPSLGSVSSGGSFGRQGSVQRVLGTPWRRRRTKFAHVTGAEQGSGSLDVSHVISACADDMEMAGPPAPTSASSAGSVSSALRGAERRVSASIISDLGDDDPDEDVEAGPVSPCSHTISPALSSFGQRLVTFDIGHE
jgi:hypothetical protein